MRAVWPFFVLCLATGAAAQSAPPGAAACTGCHGLGEDAPYPIDTLTADQIAAALADFRSGEREATVMGRIAPGFTEAESRAIAEWFANRE